MKLRKEKLGWKNEMAYFYTTFHPSIEKVNSMRLEHKVGERVLGTDPATGKQVSVKSDASGYLVVQIGEASDDENLSLQAFLKVKAFRTLHSKKH